MSMLASNETTRFPLSWLFLPWVGFMVATLVIGTIAAVGHGDPNTLVTSWGVFPDFAMFAIVLYVLGSCVAVAILYALLRSRGLGFGSVGLAGTLDWKGVALAAAAVVIGFVLYLAVDALTGTVGVPMYWYEGGRSAAQLTSVGDVALVLVFAVLLGPVVEEIIFRGYVLTALLGRGLRLRSALLLSALIFMSVHVFYGPGVLLFIFLWAFIPAALYYRTGRLHSAMLFHVVNNFIAFVIVPLAL
jgi:membrane protease YdiL (CAAX protease family)